MSYAKVCILKKPGEFDEPLTYELPGGIKSDCQVGQAVKVPLRGKEARGIIVERLDTLSEDVGAVKPVTAIIPDFRLGRFQVGLAKQIAAYYHCSLLRALKLMTPNMLWQGKGARVRAKLNEINEADCRSFPLAPLKHQLTKEQEEALNTVLKAKKPVLMKGVTGSGKTEVYLRAILETIRAGKQAILLVPEIALTPQMIEYFHVYFGPHMALFHSKLSASQRLLEWYRVQKGAAPLVIGSRSAIFAPVSNLGLLILDEEHEWTYKQESMPYYDAHRVAEMVHELTECRIVFGSATPVMDSFYKAEAGEYEKVVLRQRVNEDDMPKVHIVDLREEFRRRNYSIFSGQLQNKIKERLDAGEQIILFVNQRGMARAVVCRDCGLAEQCPHCEVSLKLHGGSYGTKARLLCHYCDFRKDPELLCPHCQSPNIRYAGLGTERVEEELFKLFPSAKVIRADKDSTSDKYGFEPIYKAFKRGDYQVLVGTQMVAKGLDFPNVTLIGIVLADIGLHIPDFRSHERLFQLITQVAGRAGRGKATGEVVLQTYQPDHPAIRRAASYGYEDFAKEELDFRKRLKYPPFSNLMKFTVVGADPEKLKKRVEVEKEQLAQVIGNRKAEVTVMSAPALIPKVAGRYYYQVLLRGQGLHSLLEDWSPPKDWRVDIDPIHVS